MYWAVVKELKIFGSFLNHWYSVLNRLAQNVHTLERELSNRYRIGIKTKDIFDNIQIFYPTDDPHTIHVDWQQFHLVVNPTFCRTIDESCSICNYKKNPT